MTDAERIAGLEGQLKAQAGNAAEEARQNAAELGHLRQRIADMEAALTKKWDEDWREHNPDEARAHDIIKRAAALLQSDRERADAAEKRITQLEHERNRAVIARNAHCKKWLDAERRVTSYHDRAKAAEARLAQARKNALEEAAKLCDEWLAAYGKVDLQYVSAREYAGGAIADLAEVLRALASDTDTGGEQP